MTTTMQRPDVIVARRRPLFRVLIGLTTVAVLLQGLWAGIFLEHDGKRDSASFWIDVHARGADVAIVLAVAAAVSAFVQLRERKDLWVGAGGLAVLLIAESYLGGLIVDQSQDTLTAIHVPLATTIVALSVGLVMRGRNAPRP